MIGKNRDYFDDLKKDEDVDHSKLMNLDYEKSGHTGFQKAMVYDLDLKSYLIEN